MALKRHFYFSQEQKEYKELWHDGDGPSSHTLLCELEDDGQVVEYTQCSAEPIDYRWNDGVYLGYGIIHSIDGVKQF